MLATVIGAGMAQGCPTGWAESKPRQNFSGAADDRVEPRHDFENEFHAAGE